MAAVSRNMTGFRQFLMDLTISRHFAKSCSSDSVPVLSLCSQATVSARLKIRGRLPYLSWAYEVLGYWQGLLRTYAEHGVAPFSGRGEKLTQKMETPTFGYLSTKDALLIRDALLLECDAFITMDNKLVKNRGHIERELSLKILSPSDYWELLIPSGCALCLNRGLTSRFRPIAKSAGKA